MHHIYGGEKALMESESTAYVGLKYRNDNCNLPAATTYFDDISFIQEEKQCNLSLYTATQTQQLLEEDLLREEARISTSHYKRGFVRDRTQNGSDFSIDRVACESLSNIIRTANMSLEEATRCVRGETKMDIRPNKALNSERLRLVLSGYPHLDLLLQIANHGIDVELKQCPQPQRPPPKNHGSCRRYLRAVTKSIRDGQNCCLYMVVDANILDLWSEVVCSLGAVEKKNVDPYDEVRMIHDLSFPKTESVNSSFVVDSVPKVQYKSVITLARRIEQLVADGHTGRIYMLKDDVKGAFCHLRTRSNQVFRMAAIVKELDILIIDMAAPFGWSGSPPCYALFGRAISWLMGSNSPASVSSSVDHNPFFPYEWVDDHIVVEPKVGDRLHLAEATLRHAMLAMLGPRDKRSQIFQLAHGSSCPRITMEYSRRTVSIPMEKITKARNRVSEMLTRGRDTKTEFYKVLGSLRHVAICLRSAKPFYQRLQSQCNAAPRFSKMHLSDGTKDDLKWFCQILLHGNLAELLLSMFGDTPTPAVELYMDASNAGLAILNPSSNQFLQIQFDETEQEMISRSATTFSEFSINVREHLCIALALWTWGSQWNRQSAGRLTHVKCWSDNIAAVNWCNKLHSKNPFSQEINRSIGLAESFFNLRVSAGHIPGSTNWMAGAVSRAWTEPYLTRWANFSSCWSQTEVPLLCRKIYMKFSSLFSPNHWPRPQNHSTIVHGISGVTGASGSASRSGYLKGQVNIPTSSLCSLRTPGVTAGVGQQNAMLPAPCSPNVAMCRGIIDEFLDTESHSCLVTSSPSLECGDPIRPGTQSHLSQQKFSKKCMTNSTFHQPSTESHGGFGAGFLLSSQTHRVSSSRFKSPNVRYSEIDVKFVDHDEFEVARLKNVAAVVINFRGSRTDQFGEETSRKLTRSGHNWCCPALATRYLVEHHKFLGVQSDTLLCKIDRSTNLQVQHVVDAIQLAAQSVGKVPSSYGSRSLRSGGATALFNAGFDKLAVKLF